MRKPTLEENEDQDNNKIELMAEDPPCDISSPAFSRQEQSMLSWRRLFIIPTTPVREPLFINQFTLYNYDAADVMDDDNFATVLESFVMTLWYFNQKSI